MNFLSFKIVSAGKVPTPSLLQVQHGTKDAPSGISRPHPPLIEIQACGINESKKSWHYSDINLFVPPNSNLLEMFRKTQKVFDGKEQQGQAHISHIQMRFSSWWLLCCGLIYSKYVNHVNE